MSVPSYSSAALGLIIGCIVFGLGSLIVVHVHIGAYAIAFWRLAVAAVIFAVLSRQFAQKFPHSLAAHRNALIAGGFLGLDLALWHESIYAVGPGISTVLNCLQIFWLAAIGKFWMGETINRLQLFSLIIALSEIILIGSPEFKHNQHALWGFVSGILSGMMLALSMLFVRKTHQAAPTPIFPMMFYISIGGMLALIIPMLWLNAGNLLPRTTEQIGWIIVYGVVIQCFAWGMIAYAIPLLSLSLAGLLLLTEPLAALLIDFRLLHKPINSIQWSGTLLTLFAIYLGSFKPKKPIQAA